MAWTKGSGGRGYRRERTRIVKLRTKSSLGAPTFLHHHALCISARHQVPRDERADNTARRTIHGPSKPGALVRGDCLSCPNLIRTFPSLPTFSVSNSLWFDVANATYHAS